MSREIVYFYKGKEVDIKSLLKKKYDMNTVSNLGEDELIDELANALEANDMKLYEKIVDENLETASNLNPDFWMETFSGDSQEEILFWIGYKKRTLTIIELSVIKKEFNYLFLEGLDREDLDLSETYEIIENLEEDISRLKEAEKGEVIKEPKDYSALKGTFYEVDKRGIRRCLHLGNPDGPPKVIISDESMKKVDFTNQKKFLQSRIDAIKKALEL